MIDHIQTSVILTTHLHDVCILRIQTIYFAQYIALSVTLHIIQLALRCITNLPSPRITDIPNTIMIRPTRNRI